MNNINVYYSYQCKRRVCRKADKPSIITNMANVKRDHAAKKMYIFIDPTYVASLRAIWNTIFHNTSDSSGIITN